MKTTRDLGRIFSATCRKMVNFENPRDAASISYFGLFALVPAILVLIGLVDTFLGWMNLHRTVLQRVTDLFPGSRGFLRSNLNELINPSTAVTLSCFIVVLWSSTLIFTFLEGAINRAWGASNQKSFWESRIRSFAFMLLGGASLLTSSISTVMVSTIRNRAIARMPDSMRSSFFIGWFWYFILLGTGLLIAVLVFTLVFKVVPHCKVRWSEAISGAIVSTVLWEVGSLIFVKLVPYFDYQRVYGRMGAVIALLTWVYTSSLILLFGANFSAQLHAIAAEEPVPESGALRHENISRFPSRYSRR